MKPILSILLLFTFISCSTENAEQNENQTISVLSEKTKKHYTAVYDRNGVIGTRYFKTCGDDHEHFSYLRDSVSISELLYMLDDTCSPAFKVFLIQEIHSSSPEYDSFLRTKFEADSTKILFTTSCVGIAFYQTLGMTCRNILIYNSFMTPEGKIVDYMKHKRHFFPDSILSYSTDKFPESWDTKRKLRKSDSEVLMWEHICDSIGREFKLCLTYLEQVDSSGDKNIIIEQSYSESPYFDKWKTAYITVEIDSVEFTDLLKKDFNHNPKEFEMYQLFDEFRIHAIHENWMTIEAGIDLSLWAERLGYTPLEYFSKVRSHMVH
ncbi:hypothetical protein K6119_04330 [Paracrocinitomix mangrovi]|uniref:hypothetical protein n=1 Tax=Paracrocinitomix mangrovi TaxID=2862509 RepID=UPI001C8EC699|nr:hypothetical protein [Paracrocinitomix mangrovi]UKN02741.1 hypothetical protein K6119_04330 [Paracrocinitomix mangrovi]